MGIANSLFLIVVASQAVVFRYRFTDTRLTPCLGYDLVLWLSLCSIGFVAVRTLVMLF